MDAVVGPQSYQIINKIIEKVENKKKRSEETNFDVIDKFDKLKLIKNSNSKVSSFLTIQEGCDKFCKFCVVHIQEVQNFLEVLKKYYKKQIN